MSLVSIFLPAFTYIHHVFTLAFFQYVFPTQINGRLSLTLEESNQLFKKGKRK